MCTRAPNIRVSLLHTFSELRLFPEAFDSALRFGNEAVQPQGGDLEAGGTQRGCHVPLQDAVCSGLMGTGVGSCPVIRPHSGVTDPSLPNPQLQLHKPLRKLGEDFRLRLRTHSWPQRSKCWARCELYLKGHIKGLQPAPGTHWVTGRQGSFRALV